MQDKSCREDVLNKTPLELVVSNVMKFDILPSEVDWGTAVRDFFLTSLTPSQYCECWTKPWFDCPLGTFFLNLGLDLERA